MLRKMVSTFSIALSADEKASETPYVSRLQRLLANATQFHSVAFQFVENISGTMAMMRWLNEDEWEMRV
jgi:hypothetical protein